MNRISKSILAIASAAVMLVCSVPAQAASFVYDNYLNGVWTGAIATGNTYKCALVSSAGVSAAAKKTNVYLSDVTGEVSGTGYTAGGNTVVPTFTLNTTSDQMVITFPTTAWASSTITARGAVCYASTGTASTSRLVFLNDFGADVTSTSGTFTLNASTLSFTAP